MAGSLFDKIKEKLPLDKLKNIKLDLPFLKKKKVETEEADEPNKKQPDLSLADKNTHLSDKTDPGVAVSTGDSTETDQSIEKIEGQEKKKSFLFQNIKNTKFSPFKIIVILGVLYLVFDTLMSDPPVEEAPVEVVKPKKKKKKKNPVVDQAVVDPSTATPAPDATATPTVDNIDVAATPEATPLPEVSVTPAELASPEATATPAPSENPLEDLNVDEINKEAEKIEKKEEEKVVETPTPEPTTTTPKLSDITEDQKEETGEAKDKTDKSKDSGNIADDLLNNLENKDEGTDTKSSSSVVKETLPPDYLRSGRGLVYNCKGKHWACVSKDQYSQCKQNHLWNQQNDKPIECNEISVYATEKDCSASQKIKIEGLAKTNFCK